MNRVSTASFAFMFAFIFMFISLFFLTAQPNAAIREAQGYRETFFVVWDKDAGTGSYTVEYRSGNGEWIEIDDELIREYPGNIMRADVLGIGAGTYDVRVTPEGGTVLTYENITVTAHERTGFAFMNGVVPGAYKDDGTLKDGAVVIYVTDQNKATITARVKDVSSGAMTTYTGIQPIIKAFEKGYEDRPFVFRFIGRVTDKDVELDKGDINIKGTSNSSRTFPHLTFEGVGNDATLYGFGIKTARAKYLEIRNLGFMLTNSAKDGIGGGDNIGLDDNSEHVWIHHNDMFYGNPGNDNDQAKGDGATDAKSSTFVTIAYNRYWDTGKTHLLGNSTSEPPGSITLHHNWYDHSDSRHPRVRTHNVHVYNNFYSNVSAYGIGASVKSSIFAERNYFVNTYRPMTISMQGSDKGTFTSEDGGMIKAFDNYLDEFSRKSYTPWSAEGGASTSFDAYEVTSASAEVPNSVKAKQGGWTFNNAALLPPDYPPYITQNDSAAVREQVTTYAGRYWKGDFTYNIDNGRSGDIISGLKTALQNYKGCVIAIQGTDFFAVPGGNCETQHTSVTDRAAAPNDHKMTITRAGGGIFRINYTMRNRGAVRIDLFDVRGKMVRTAVNASKDAGTHQAHFSAHGLAAGTYVVRLRTGDQTLRERLMIVR